MQSKGVCSLSSMFAQCRFASSAAFTGICLSIPEGITFLTIPLSHAALMRSFYFGLIATSHIHYNAHSNIDVGRQQLVNRLRVLPNDLIMQVLVPNM